MEQKYIVRGGGWYVGVYNTRTKKYCWKNERRGLDLKKTETNLLTKEQAEELEQINDRSFLKMANLKIEEA